MKLFRLYRHKKYGEPLDPLPIKSNASDALNDSNQFSEEEVKSMKKRRTG